MRQIDQHKKIRLGKKKRKKKEKDSKKNEQLERISSGERAIRAMVSTSDSRWTVKVNFDAIVDANFKF